MKKTMNSPELKAKILGDFRLEALEWPVNLDSLAAKWGVTAIEKQPISSAGMLLPNRNGYKVILNQNQSRVRQRFSLAHELGHLLFNKAGIADSVREPKRRNSLAANPAEERLCDQIAAEILMPRMAFYEDGWMEGWSLNSLRTLASKYETSIPATALRMVDLMPEESLMGVWKVSEEGKKALQWPHAGKTDYAIPSPSIIAEERMELVSRAWHSYQVESGFAPVKLGRAKPVDVPSEAMAWGRGEYKQVMAFYYPGRRQENKVG